MKCKYCNTEIEQDAQFCTNCGKDLSKFRRCVNCGELLDRDAFFCPYCGTETEPPENEPSTDKSQKTVEERQTEEMNCKEQVSELEKEERVSEDVTYDSEEVEEKYHSKKWLWIACSILLMGVAIGGVYFYLNKNDEKTDLNGINNGDEEYVEENLTKRQIEDSDDKLPNAIDIKDRFKEGYSHELSMLEERVWKEVPEFGEISFMGVPFSDCEVTSVTLNKISVITPTTAKAEAKVVYKSGDDISTQVNNVTLILENGNWVIDDYDGWKGLLQKKLDEANNAEEDKLSEMAMLNRERAQFVTMDIGFGVYGDVLQRRITESDLSDLSKDELSTLRNSIYAHHGYRFTRDDLFNYFSQFSWYNPTTSDMNAVYNSMSDIEKYNIDFIKSHE